MKLVSILIFVCALVYFVQAVQKGDEYFTQRIRAKFDDNTIIWTTNAEARQRGMIIK